MHVRILSASSEISLSGLTDELRGAGSDDVGIVLSSESRVPPHTTGVGVGAVGGLLGAFIGFVLPTTREVEHIVTIVIQNPLVHVAVGAAAKAAVEKSVKWAAEYRRQTGKKIRVELYGPDNKLIMRDD